MRIYALEILFAVGVLNVPALGAEAVQRESPSLPQFIPPAMHAGADTTKLATDETRRAAEALSAKFSGDRAGASADDAEMDRETSKTPLPALVDPPSNSATSAHVAVLRARPPASATAPKKSKNIRSRTTRPGPSNSRAMKSANRDGRRPPVDAGMQGLAPNPVPGAQVGWKTGLIGMLTNPAFWH